MASTASFNVIDDDDDDGFDWEAAVKAIDSACDTIASIKPSNGNKPPTTSCRQSTLDKFIKSDYLHSNPRPRSRSPTPPVPNSYDVKIDTEAAKTWIYPVNIALREYQFSITETALFSNTLVALPTGLGKTLIAAVVMYNYFRWFPEGKIVFAAPSRPLVTQQIEACHNIVGIPQEWTIDMTGQTSPTTRACYWKSKRVFFVTPQVLEKDIQSGSCLVKHLVCLVIDEAHRASGNYSYCVVVRELMAVPVQMRILALTATPGAKQQKIQEVIDNLQISKLEYRNENDHDVAPYVHDRKIELIEVPMGNEAVEVNNLLLEVTRPFVAKLSAMGVPVKQSSPPPSTPELLNLKEKFHEPPPQDLHHIQKHRDVDTCIGVLITLNHIRKLLSSHGIRPAFETLEEKLKQGSFARYMSRNEVMWKAKFRMQQTLSHGDHSPKLSKMLEVLVEHFKTKDPRNSRVIIFSNFRGSVRDIMDALASIGEYVKATEFIGQSSGKTSKGQSQKVQQAVLQKFRAGGYNVIVATSIGEEGLDIMEVDLVICFDANVSHLRMIQRMGRTGRKNEGIVVVLACEGLELKGYLQKQASSKNIKKHMQNGGKSSFQFHSSPRMVPHVFKPKVQYIEFSIEQFVHRGKKVKDDEPIKTTTLNTKLTDAEIDLVAKYFNPSRENKWRPSFIAFPQFQAYPSRVHEVAHSARTGILIDTMQQLQEISFSCDSIAFSFEGAKTSEWCFEQSGSSPKGLQLSRELPEGELIRQEPETNNIIHAEKSRSKAHSLPDCVAQNPPVHSFLFGSDFVSVDSLGRVKVVSVPVLPLNDVCHSKCSSPSSPLVFNCFKEDDTHLRASLGESEGICMKVKAVSMFETRCLESQDLRTPVTKRSLYIQTGKDQTVETSDILESKTTAELLLEDECNTNLKDVDLSPRLTNYIECGVVPESPIDSGILRSKEDEDLMVADLDTSTKLHSESITNLSVPIINNKGSKVSNPNEGDVVHSWIKDKLRSPVLDLVKCSPKRCISDSKLIDGIQTPQQNLSDGSCSKDWALSSGEKSGSVKPKQKLKRLLKYGDIKRSPHAIEEKVGPSKIEVRSDGKPNICADKHGRGDSKQANGVRVFIEEEAEVSLEVPVSDDEEYDQENSYDDSFIDDRLDFTVTSTRAETTSPDMMAIYRRSLLSQSPFVGKPDSSSELSSSSTIPTTGFHESGTLKRSPHTPQTDFKSTNENPSVELNSKKIYSEAMSITENRLSRENASKTESRKRKLDSVQCGSLPIHNLEREFFSLPDQVSKNEGTSFTFDDDDFYEDIDLDALEEQAVKQLISKSENKVTKPTPENLIVPPGSPTFDLGI